MPGIATGVEGAKAFDEVAEQLQGIEFRNRNDGKPPDKKVIVEPETTSEFRSSVLNALGVGRNITGTG